jgi:hypothetical protein
MPRVVLIGERRFSTGLARDRVLIGGQQFPSLSVTADGLVERHDPAIFAGVGNSISVTLPVPEDPTDDAAHAAPRMADANKNLTLKTAGTAAANLRTSRRVRRLLASRNFA